MYRTVCRLLYIIMKYNFLVGFRGRPLKMEQEKNKITPHNLGGGGAGS